MYERLCPSCGKTLNYKIKKQRNRAEKLKKCCRSCSRVLYFKKPESESNRNRLGEYSREHYCGQGNPFYGKKHTAATIAKIQHDRDTTVFHTEEFKDKMSTVTSGTKNPMHGRNIYDIWVAKYGQEEADRRAAVLAKQRSENASGEKNPMYGRPAPRGSGGGLSGWYKGWYFRSLKELSYMLFVIERFGYEWESAEQKCFSIPYIDYYGKNRTYRADFLLNKHLLIEVKPRQLMDTAANHLKKQAAEQFCFARGYEYRMVDVKTIDKKSLIVLVKAGLVIMADPACLE